MTVWWWAGTAIAVLALGTGAVRWVTGMPGRSPARAATQRLPAGLQAALQGDVEYLAGVVGERHVGRPDALAAAAAYVGQRLSSAGHRVERQGFSAAGREVFNLAATLPGVDPGAGAVVIGAHYDTVPGSPGADDNASGVAALLALAAALPAGGFRRPVRLVAFVNEEPPFFQGPQMGSRVYASSLAAHGPGVHAMLSLEMLGCYDDRPGSQRYPFPLGLLYPGRGDFLAVVGDLRNRSLVRRVVAAMRASGQLPVEGIAAPAAVPGVSWSDHDSFWRHGWPAAMITDTAFYRNPHYHAPSDLPRHVDSARLGCAVMALREVIGTLAGNPASGP